jgi:hypothetical protein
MPMRLCILGNSHISALKRAWDTAPRGAGVTATFFGSTSQMARFVELHGGALRPTVPTLRAYFLKTAGQVKVRVADYDAFVLVGLGLGPVNTAKAYETHRLPEHCGDTHRPVSRAALDQAAYDMLNRMAARLLVKLIRRASPGMPIVLVPEPYPCAGAGESEPWWADPSVRATLLDAFNLALARLADDLRVDLAPQPAETMDNGFTAARFGIGAIDALMDFEYRDSDYRHMNDAYGVEVWRELLPMLTPPAANPAMRPGRAPAQASRNSPASAVRL